MSTHEDYLNSIAYENFLFLDPKKVEDATRQILNVEQYLKRNLPKFNFKIFGSFRNRTSLCRDIDGDVCIYSYGFIGREMNILNEVKESF